MFKTSAALYERARSVIPGGVNSPVRAFGAVGGTPVFLRSASGAWVEDEDGRRYIDYVGSWGPMLFGHAEPAIVQAVAEAAKSSTSFGAPTRLEAEMAEIVSEIVPSIEMVRMVNSGTEATMSAVRLARGFTGRDKIIKFEGIIMAMPISFLRRRAAAPPHSGILIRPGCRFRRSGIRCWHGTMISKA